MPKASLSAVVSAAEAWRARSVLSPAFGVSPGSARFPRWTIHTLGGCLAELSGRGAAPVLTLAFSLVRQIQQRHEPVAWITSPGSTFFPPDAADGGVDLSTLPVIQLAEVRQRVRAADHLARSGAFGLIVIDLEDCLDLPLAIQTRLTEHALTSQTLIVCLTTKTDRQPSLGSLVTVRGQATRLRQEDGRFVCRVQAVKDKRRGPGWTDEEWCRGPDGVC